MTDDNSQQLLEQEAAPEPEKLVPMTDLDMFVRTLSAWHEHKVKVLEHMLKIPDGTPVQFNGEPEQILTGDLKKGFTIGLSLALMELGVLPFVAETTDAPANDPTIHDAPTHTQ